MNRAWNEPPQHPYRIGMWPLKEKQTESNNSINTESPHKNLIQGLAALKTKTRPTHEDEKKNQKKKEEKEMNKACKKYGIM